MKNVLISTLISLFAGSGLYAQSAPNPEGQPDRYRRPGDMRPGGPPRSGQRDWMRGVDTNNDGKLNAPEFNSALDATFSEIDRNANGMIDTNEMPHPPRAPRPPMAGDRDPQGPPTVQRDNLYNPSRGASADRPMGPPRGRDGESPRMLPPFFFIDRAYAATSTSRAEFEKIARGVFNEMDGDGDGSISHEEARPPHRPDGPRDAMAPPPPSGRFIAAELRFGDRLVVGQPFSAETVTEDTRRLFDGSTVVHSSRGAIYRDFSGRTRREQPLEMVGGVSIAGSDGKAQTLVFINDFAADAQYFVDVTNKIVRKTPIGYGRAPVARGQQGPDDQAKTESLGTKTIDGISVEGTRISFEIPIGQIGNEKPMQVVTENWFSPELQMMVMSRHLDPIAGEHVFKLTNIKRGEQAAELFAIPSGFRVEGERQPRPDDK